MKSFFIIIIYVLLFICLFVLGRMNIKKIKQIFFNLKRQQLHDCQLPYADYSKLWKKINPGTQRSPLKAPAGRDDGTGSQSFIMPILNSQTD